MAVRIKAREVRKRLAPELFDLPVERIRAGYYTDAYFNFARETLRADDHRVRVLMQVFQRERAVLGGIDEAIAVLELCSENWADLSVKALFDGDEIEPWETVLAVEGDYAGIAHLETVYLGILARRTKIATNVRRTVEAAAGKPVLFFPARRDHYCAQPGDGYIARLAGATSVSTDAQGSWRGECGIGTVPHALIACYGGDAVLTARKFAAWAPPEMHLIVLVDFENDSVKTSLELARALGDRLWGVRLDTAGTLVDRSLWSEMEESGDLDPSGVSEPLVRHVRAALDREGFEQVKIVVSGGFDAEKIRAFEEHGVPVDSYGVGSSLLRGQFDFTADVVSADGRPVAKAGRRDRPNPRLEQVIG